jgi:hypothetical protein
MVRSNVSAVLRLTVSSTFVDCWTGRSGRLLAIQNTTSVDAGDAIGIGKVGSVAHQPAGRDKFGQTVDRRHTKACCEGSKLVELTIR